jgi:hypothetical protein
VLAALLRVDPAQRLTAAALLLEPWVCGLADDDDPSHMGSEDPDCCWRSDEPCARAVSLSVRAGGAGPTDTPPGSAEQPYAGGAAGGASRHALAVPALLRERVEGQRSASSLQGALAQTSLARRAGAGLYRRVSM